MVHLNRTKSGKNRSIPIDDTLYSELENLKPRTLGGNIFKPAYNQFRSAVERSRVELPNGQLSHVLRHTFATHFMMNGGNILVLQRLLGHSTLAMTMRYAHLAPDHLQEAVILNPLAKLDLVDTMLTKGE
ncbi:Phage integrase family protein [Methylobacillus rhizosphaerae]|uniref:Phage integrase family protein n=2 Tax=Methylobacillus rhizosphaerae TaxID=551994 RepID=A0A238ZJN7_9PROT|nr:Phage integrase family protein [Methylobacillus rhizosphaerae]